MCFPLLDRVANEFKDRLYNHCDFLTLLDAFNMKSENFFSEDKIIKFAKRYESDFDDLELEAISSQVKTA